MGDNPQLSHPHGVQATMTHPRDDHRLWDLLGHAPRPSAPPFFATKVLQQIDPAEVHESVWLRGLWRWLGPATVAALVVLALVPRAAPVTTPELTTLDLLEMLSPEDYDTLTQAGWPYNNGSLTAGL